MCGRKLLRASFILTGIALILLSFILPPGSENSVMTGISFGGIVLIVIGYSSLRISARRRVDH